MGKKLEYHKFKYGQLYNNSTMYKNQWTECDKIVSIVLSHMIQLGYRDISLYVITAYGA